MNLLPTNLAPLAKLCDHGSTRFAMGGINLSVTETTFTAESTDGFKAIRISGECENGDQYPEIPAIRTAPNGGTASLVPGKVWAKVFSNAKTATKSMAYPHLRSVATVIGSNFTTFGTTDLETSPVTQTRNMEGRFPALTEIMKAIPAAEFTFKVNPNHLAEALTTIAELGECSNGVTIECVKNKPMKITAILDNGQRIEAVVMPIKDKGE